MFRRKTLKRLTRFGLCFYVFSYLMAFTVCAEEYPVVGGVDASYGIPVNEGYIAAETGEDAEPDLLRGAEISYGNSTNHTVTGFFRFMMNNYWTNESAVALPTYTLGADLELDDADWKNNIGFWQGTKYYTAGNNYTAHPINNGNKLVIDGNGHRIKGRFGMSSEHNTNLDMFSFVHITLEFKNTVFENFGNSSLCYDNISSKPEGREVILTNCTFINNRGEYGGAVRADEGVKLFIENCTFINNTAEKDGGAVAVLFENSTLGVTGSKFEDNSAAEKGGAIYNNATAVSITVGSYKYYNNSIINKTVFLTNNAENGGAIYKERFDKGGKDEIHYCMFFNNSDPVIAAGELVGEPNKKQNAAFISTNWFGNSAENAGSAPNISVIPEAGNYCWNLLKVNKRVLNGVYTFRVNLNSTMYSNGSNGSAAGDIYSVYYTFPDITLKAVAENITLDSPEFTMTYNETAGYQGVFTGRDLKPGASEYSISIYDPLGNLIYGQKADRGNISAVLKRTGRNGSYADYEEGGYSSSIYKGDDLVFYVTGGGTALVNEIVKFSVNGGEAIETKTNGTGYAVLGGGNITSGGNVNISISSPLLGGVESKTYYFRQPVYTVFDLDNDAQNMTYGDNVSLIIDSTSEEGFTGGVITLYRFDGMDDIKLEAWKIDNGTLEDEGHFNATVSLSGLEAGNHTLFTTFEKAGTDTAVSDTFEIEVVPREVGIEWENKSVFVFNGNPLAPEPLATGLVNGDKIKIGVTGIGTDAGNHTVKADMLVGDRNMSYRLPAKELTKAYEIVKADGLLLNASYDVLTDDDGNGAFSLTSEKMTALMPENAKDVTYEVQEPEIISGNATVSGCSITDGVLSAKISNGKEGDSIKLPLKAGSRNYNISMVNLFLTLKKDGGGTDVPDHGGDVPYNRTDVPDNKTDVPDNITVMPDADTVVSLVNGTQTVQNLTVDLGSELAAMNISLDVIYTQNVTFTGNKFKAKDIEDLGNGTYSLGGVVIKLNTTLTEVAKPGFKFKNIKHATDNPKTKKKPCFIVSFKANSGVSKENKTAVKSANKVLKKNPVEFRIEQVDISLATDGKLFMNGQKTKVKKATMTISGNNFTLKNNKDFSYEIADPNVTLTGKGDYKGNLTINMNG